jgi:hypothetical protein
MSTPSWIGEGLRFKCVGCSCGACCNGAAGPGAVWVDQVEMDGLARHLALAFDDFTARFVRRIDGRFSLVEKPNHDCVFYEQGKGCSVYDARPRQCRTYPFWGRILASRETWLAEARVCPGIADESPLVPAREIPDLPETPA